MSIFSYIKKHSFIATVAAILIIIIAIIAGRVASRKAAPDQATRTTKVSVVNATTFRTGALSVSADGVVQSHSQADLRSQVSAPVSVINVSIGDSIYSGQTILELQNADIRAQLDSAKASLALANGQNYTGSVSLSSAGQTAIDKVRDAYIKGYDAVVTQIEPILYNADGNGGRLTSYMTNTKLNDEIISFDIDLKTAFRDWKNLSDGLTISTSTAVISQAVVVSQNNLNKINLLLSDVSQGLNDVAAYSTQNFTTQVNGWKATVSAARASVSGASQALTAAAAGLNGSNASQGSTVQAQISMAQAGVNNLQAQLAKTILVSPIAGKIASLPLHVGELASAGSLIVTVVGDTTNLQVKSFVSAEDLPYIKVNAPVTIKGQNNIKGTVSNVAPSVDASSKKAEVDIEITDSVHSSLIIGASVTASIMSAHQQASSTQPSSYILPIQNVKIIPGSAYVFTIDSDSKIKRNDVILGAIQGDFVQVISGITDDMNIVTPVYELEVGQDVQVQ